MTIVVAGSTRLIVARSKILSCPQNSARVAFCPVLQGKEGTRLPPADANGVPARYMVVPFTTATVAAGTLTAAPALFDVKSRVCTLAWVPPHSAPQFTTKAVVSSGLKNAATVRSKPPTEGTALPVTIFDGVSTDTASELSLKARIRLPVLLIARKRTAGMSISAVNAILLSETTFTAPGDCPTTEAVGT